MMLISKKIKYLKLKFYEQKPMYRTTIIYYTQYVENKQPDLIYSF